MIRERFFESPAFFLNRERCALGLCCWGVGCWAWQRVGKVFLGLVVGALHVGVRPRVVLCIVKKSAHPRGSRERLAEREGGVAQEDGVLGRPVLAALRWLRG